MTLLLWEFHDMPIGGHARIIKILKHLSDSFFWTNMHKDVQHFIQDCVVCQQTKYNAAKLGDLLQQLLVLSNIWEDIALDFVPRLLTHIGVLSS
jgi:hypothetical protein